MKEIKVLSLFSGYGGSEFSLKKAEIPFKCIGYSDIEDCANYIYELNHGTDIPQLGDITKVNAEDLEDFDLLTGGWPCQSFSICGNRKGFEDEKKGQLFFEVIRILKTKKPRYFLGENVQGLLSHDNGLTMKITLNELKLAGYHVKWKLLWSKEHGTPQNRPRVWFACFRDKVDADKFMFPEKEPLKITVKDLLDDVVDDKYYLNENQLKKINEYNIKNKSKGRGFRLEPTKDVSKTITSHCSIDINDIPFIADYRYDEGLRPRRDNICPTLNARKRENDLSGCPIILTGLQEHQQFKNDGICSTLNNAMGLGGGHIPMIMDNKTKNHNTSGISGTVHAGGGSGNNILSGCSIINTITTGYGRQGSSKEFIAINKQINEVTNKWRRLSPTECFRLQGFFTKHKDEQITFDEINFGNLSDSKLYFLAGNGWDINTASKIFIQMFKGNQNPQKTLFE